MEKISRAYVHVFSTQMCIVRRCFKCAHTHTHDFPAQVGLPVPESHSSRSLFWRRPNALMYSVCVIMLRERQVGVRFWLQKANSDPTHSKGDQTHTHTHTFDDQLTHTMSTQKALYCTHPMCFVMVFAVNMGPGWKPCGLCEFYLVTQTGPV